MSSLFVRAWLPMVALAWLPATATAAESASLRQHSVVPVAQRAGERLLQNQVTDQQIIEEVVVTGVRPGPPLWKVTHNNHVLWLFGTLSPIPKRMEWDSAAVEYIISEADSYLAPPGVHASISNPFKALGYLRRYNKAKKLPNKRTLADVLSPDLNSEFERIRTKYARRSKAIRKLRPFFAAEKLLEEATQTVGLTDDSARIERTLEKLINRHDVAVIESAIEAPLVDFFVVLESLSLQTEIACLKTTLNSIEQDLSAAAKRANAWADGDASALAALDYPDVEGSCTKVIFERPQAAALQTRVETLWLDHAEAALQQQSITFADLPMGELVHPDGLLARLRARGYSVSTPSS